jgi:XapX domain-containing protein
MTAAIIGLLLGQVIGAACRIFDIPSSAPPRLIGACLLLAMTAGFVTADHLLPPRKTLVRLDALSRPRSASCLPSPWASPVEYSESHRRHRR